MDFETVLRKLVAAFQETGIQYGLIGGFAMGTHGLMRTTMDLDFLIQRQNVEQLEMIMDDLGYKRFYESENVSQYISDDKLFGEVDFLHAFRSRSLQMLKRTMQKNVFHKRVQVQVVCPEDLIGLKLQSAGNDPHRRLRDHADIEMIMACLGKTLDWSIIRDYFELFKNISWFENLREYYDPTYF